MVISTVWRDRVPLLPFLSLYLLFIFLVLLHWPELAVLCWVMAVWADILGFIPIFSVKTFSLSPLSNLRYLQTSFLLRRVLLSIFISLNMSWIGDQCRQMCFLHQEIRFFFFSLLIWWITLIFQYKYPPLDKNSSWAYE